MSMFVRALLSEIGMDVRINRGFIKRVGQARSARLVRNTTMSGLSGVHNKWGPLYMKIFTNFYGHFQSSHQC